MPIDFVGQMQVWMANVHGETVLLSGPSLFKLDFFSVGRKLMLQLNFDIGTLSRNEVYFSNRSAAFSQLKDYEPAIRDAKSAIRLKPEWVKGWARLACAHYGLEEFSEAKDAYKKAINLEPEDESLHQGFFKVR